ncbi:MAG: PilZ domain-containing protein [Alphaproteobacteria bacterium]
MLTDPAPSETIPEQRRAQRRRVLWSGTIEFDGTVWPCLLLDLSATGAKLRIEQTETEMEILVPPVHSIVAVSTKHFEAMRAKVVWRRRDHAGICFEETPARVAAVLARVLPLFRSDGSVIAPEPQQQPVADDDEATAPPNGT